MNIKLRLSVGRSSVISKSKQNKFIINVRFCSPVVMFALGDAVGQSLVSIRLETSRRGH